MDFIRITICRVLIVLVFSLLYSIIEPNIPPDGVIIISILSLVAFCMWMMAEIKRADYLKEHANEKKHTIFSVLMVFGAIASIIRMIFVWIEHFQR